MPPPPPPRHAGDWGNITSDRMGKVDATMTVNNSLHGAHSIVGRGIVVSSHAINVFVAFIYYNTLFGSD